MSIREANNRLKNAPAAALNAGARGLRNANDQIVKRGLVNAGLAFLDNDGNSQ